MQSNFDKSLAAVLVHEGGYVNHPRDPGGATNKGVTQAVYDGYRVRKGMPKQSVRSIADAEVSYIYKVQYWDAVKGDELPSGVDYCVFDFAVNSGVSRASKFLQAAVGVKQDGQIGFATMEAVRNASPSGVVTSVCDARLAFLKRLSTWDVFGKGWASRVAGVRKMALGMAGSAKAAPVAPSAPALTPTEPKTDLPAPDKPMGLLAALIAVLVKLFARKQ
jgi:lysozyme family protein